MRSAHAVLLVLLAASTAAAEPEIHYAFEGEGVVLREQVLALRVAPRRVEDPPAARTDGALLFENTAAKATTLVFRVVEEDAFSFTLRNHRVCIQGEDDPSTSAAFDRLREQLDGRRKVTAEYDDEGSCAPLGPVSKLALRGAPPASHRLAARHEVAVGGRVLSPSAQRWESRPELSKEDSTSGSLQFTQTLEYRIAVPAGAKVEVRIADKQPLRSIPGCCSEHVVGTFTLLRADVAGLFGAPAAMT